MATETIRITTGIDKDLAESITDLANAEKRSVSQMIAILIEEAFKARKTN